MNQTKLKLDQLKLVGHILGREISVSTSGDVDTFSEFSVADLAELRMLNELSSPLALFYIRFRLKEGVTLRQAVSFLSEVLQQGRSLEEWCDGQGE